MGSMTKDKSKIKEIMTPILVEAGAALQDCQMFEYGLGLLLLHFSRLGAKGLDPTTLYAIMEGEKKKTAGQLLRILRENLHVSPRLEAALPEALAARNRLIHRVLIDNIEHFLDADARNQVIKEIRRLRSTVRKADALIRPFIEGLSLALDGYDAKADLKQAIKKINADDN